MKNIIIVIKGMTTTDNSNIFYNNDTDNIDREQECKTLN